MDGLVLVRLDRFPPQHADMEREVAVAGDDRAEFLSRALPALDLVYNLARRMMPDHDLAQDLVQETYVKAFEAWRAGRKPRRVEPWLATICLNAGRSYWRRASTKRETMLEDIDSEAAGDEDVLSSATSSLRRRLVHEALWKLPEEQRVAITLMDLDGFSASEVARITKAPRGTVLSRVHRGRKRLARLLGKEVQRLET